MSKTKNPSKESCSRGGDEVRKIGKRKSGVSAKDRMRKYRENIKKEPKIDAEMKQKERERWKRRVAEGKVKTAKSDLSDRERRALRKKWRKKTSKYRQAVKERKKLLETLERNSPPHSPEVEYDLQEIHPENHKNEEKTLEDKRKVSGHKRRRKHRKLLNDKIKELEEKLLSESRKAQKYRQRCHRMQKAKERENKGSPRTKVNNLVRGQKVSPVIKKKLLFHEVIGNHIKSSFRNEKRRNSKHEFVTKLYSRLIKKYKCITTLRSFTSRRSVKENYFGRKTDTNEKTKDN